MRSTRSTLGAVIALAILAGACGGPDSSPATSSEDALRWRWCRRDAICRVPGRWWKQCTDLSSDPRNCGGCGVACATGEACVSGQCRATCGDGLVGCPSAATSATTCTDLSCTAEHCGACGNQCAAKDACVQGACTDPCPLGRYNCGTAAATACADLQGDTANCGACGNACAQGDVCVNGGCQPFCSDTVNNPSECTDASGQRYCTNFQTDSGNCGACGNVCGGGTVCIQGECRFDCSATQLACATGCVDPLNDPSNCGGCGIACASGYACEAGACAIQCAAGDLRCDPQTCVNPATDAQNCGACGTACAAGQTCVGGGCACPTGQSLCGGACVDTAGDVSNCGSCGNACAAGQVCVASTCETPSTGNSYDASVVFDEVTNVPVTTLAFDGTSLWTGGRFVRTAPSTNWAWYSRNGDVLGTCPVVSYDTRGIFSAGDGGPVRMRMASTGTIYQMNGCTPASSVASLVAPTGWSWSGDVNVVMTGDASTYVAMSNGVVHRWDATGAYLGSTTLVGWGADPNEALAPQNVRVAVAGNAVLTYAMGTLSVWNADGSLARTIQLRGAGTTPQSHYSLSFADGLVWILDDQGLFWRGYLIGQ